MVLFPIVRGFGWYFSEFGRGWGDTFQNCWGQGWYFFEDPGVRRGTLHKCSGSGVHFAKLLGSEVVISFQSHLHLVHRISDLVLNLGHLRSPTQIKCNDRLNAMAEKYVHVVVGQVLRLKCVCGVFRWSGMYSDSADMGVGLKVVF